MNDREVPMYKARIKVKPSPNPRHRQEPPFASMGESDVWQYADRIIEAGEIVTTTEWNHPTFQPLNASAKRVSAYFSTRMKSRLPRSPWHGDRLRLDDGFSSVAVTHVKPPQLTPWKGNAA